MLIALDAREILMQLNLMGYRNVTAEQLKEFMKDLKRLIKYENKYSNDEPDPPTTLQSQILSQIQNNFEKLHITSTIASRAKTAESKNKQTNKSVKPNAPEECAASATANKSPQKDKSVRHNLSTRRKTIESRVHVKQNENVEPVIAKTSVVPSRCTLTTPDTGSGRTSAASTTAATSSTQTNTNKKFIRNTPIDLYQNYQKDWQRFKRFVPGETSRSNVRLAIRKRMEQIQKPQPKPKVYLSVASDQTKTIKRV